MDDIYSLYNLLRRSINMQTVGMKFGTHRWADTHTFIQTHRWADTHTFILHDGHKVHVVPVDGNEVVVRGRDDWRNV